jgi:hypothetical protein
MMANVRRRATLAASGETAVTAVPVRGGGAGESGPWDADVADRCRNQGGPLRGTHFFKSRKTRGITTLRPSLNRAIEGGTPVLGPEH